VCPGTAASWSAPLTFAHHQHDKATEVDEINRLNRRLAAAPDARTLKLYKERVAELENALKAAKRQQPPPPPPPFDYDTGGGGGAAAGWAVRPHVPTIPKKKAGGRNKSARR